MNLAKYVVVALAMLVLGVAHLTGGEPAEHAWFVRAVVYAEGTWCEGTAVTLNVEPWSSEPLHLPLKAADITDAEWDVMPLEPGTYELHVQVNSCGGRSGQFATLEFDYDENNRRKEVYVGLRLVGGTLNLDYIEIATAWKGAPFFSVTSDNDKVILTNVSDAELRRCEFERPYVYEEYFADGKWDPFNLGRKREWPQTTDSLAPGDSVVLKLSRSVTVIKSTGRPPRVVQPSAKRFIVIAQPQKRHFLVLAEPKWAPGGLPSCDRYYLEFPTTEADPSVKIWE